MTVVLVRQTRVVIVKPPTFFGGGPSQQQKDAATRQAALEAQQAKTSDQMLSFWKDAYNKISPFATERLNNGLPFYNDMIDYAGGENARAYLPARARLMRVLDQMGDLPSGAKAQTLADFESKRARDFDTGLQNAQLTNDQAKVQGAGLLTGQQAGTNPLGWSGAASGSNNSIMQAPLQSAGVLGPIAGAAGAIGSAAVSKIPF